MNKILKIFFFSFMRGGACAPARYAKMPWLELSGYHCFTTGFTLVCTTGTPLEYTLGNTSRVREGTMETGQNGATAIHLSVAAFKSHRFDI
jgi:hypothetical protein